MDNNKLSPLYTKNKSLIGKKKRPSDIVLYSFIVLFAVAVVAMVVYFLVYIISQGLPTLTWELVSTAPNPIEETVGILPSIINTLYIILLSLIVAVPIGIGGAIYINEYAKNKRVIRIVEFTTETLSGIPSIIFGVFGYMFFCTMLDLGVSLLSGALTLTLIVLPTIIRTTQEALRAVPKLYREGALGMGSTKWYMIRTILLPSSAPGILTSVILSVGRIVGESAALLLVAGGMGTSMPEGNFFEQILGGGSTLSVELYRYASTRGENEIAFSIALVLLLIVLVLNLITRLLSRRLSKKI